MGRIRSERVLPMLVVVFLFVGLVFGDAGVGVEEVPESGDLNVSLLKDIDRLKEEIGSLEGKLKEKDAHIGVVETELESLRKSKDTGEALLKLETELEGAIVRAKDAEEELVIARKAENDAKAEAAILKQRVEVADKSVVDLQGKYDKTVKALEEQKKRAKTAEDTLRVAEAAMLKAESDAKKKAQELLRVYKQWLPPWAATRAATLQTKVTGKFASHVQPHVNSLLGKASQHATVAQEWAKPHIENVKSKVRPAAERHWKTISDTIVPHVENFKLKTSKGYAVIRNEYISKALKFVQPYRDAAFEISRPYVIVIQEHTRPYVDQISSITKPHLDHARKVIVARLDKIVPWHRDVVTAAVKYHERIQETVRGTLSKHELAAALVTNELVWFLASALLALPVFTVLLILSSAFGGGKKKKPTTRRSVGTHSSKPRRAKKVDK